MGTVVVMVTVTATVMVMVTRVKVRVRVKDRVRFSSGGVRVSLLTSWASPSSTAIRHPAVYSYPHLLPTTITSDPGRLANHVDTKSSDNPYDLAQSMYRRPSDSASSRTACAWVRMASTSTLGKSSACPRLM